MRLLIVEDDRGLRESMALRLRGAGYAVDEAGQGSAGLESAGRHPYDAIVLDVALPDMNGLDLLHELRRTGNTTLVLILTAKDALGDRITGLDLGADDCLGKPFALDELLARLRAMVRRGHERADAVIRIDDLEIDTRTHRARRAGRQIALSTREYAILEYLARRRGHIVSRTELWNHAYDNVNGSASNVLDVYIAHLRKKIDHGHAKKLIHTRRGQGYLLSG